MLCARIRRRFVPALHPVVAQYARDAQAVVGENAVAAFRLRGAMLLQVTPLLDRFFIPPEGEGKELAFLGQALEALDRDEAVDLLQMRTQCGGDTEIVAAVI